MTLDVLPQPHWRQRFWAAALEQQLAASRKGAVAAAVALGAWPEGDSDGIGGSSTAVSSSAGSSGGGRGGGGGSTSSSSNGIGGSSSSSNSNGGHSSSISAGAALSSLDGMAPRLETTSGGAPAPLRHQLAAQCLRTLGGHAAALTAGELGAALWGLAVSGVPAPRASAVAGLWQVRRRGVEQGL